MQLVVTLLEKQLCPEINIEQKKFVKDHLCVLIFK